MPPSEQTPLLRREPAASLGRGWRAAQLLVLLVLLACAAAAAAAAVAWRSGAAPMMASAKERSGSARAPPSAASAFAGWVAGTMYGSPGAGADDRLVLPGVVGREAADPALLRFKALTLQALALLRVARLKCAPRAEALRVDANDIRVAVGWDRQGRAGEAVAVRARLGTTREVVLTLQHVYEPKSLRRIDPCALSLQEGGWTKQVSAMGKEGDAAAAFIRASVNRLCRLPAGASFSTASITSAQTKVSAGVVFSFGVSLGDFTFSDVELWRKPSGTFALLAGSAKKIGARCDEMRKALATPTAAGSKEQVDALNARPRSSWTAGTYEQFAGFTRGHMAHMAGLKLSHSLPVQQKFGIHEAPPSWTAPKSFDWRLKSPGCVSPDRVRHQGICGSCWACSTTSAVANGHCILNGLDKEYEKTNAGCNGKGSNEQGTKYTCPGGLSPQSQVECNVWCTKCEGGTLGASYRWHQTSGIAAEKSYKYAQFSSGTVAKDCDGTAPIAMKIKCQSRRQTSSEQAMMHAIMTYGPITAGISIYSDFSSYKTGVYAPKKKTSEGGHAVQLVGWGTDNGLDYWVIENSWGSNWGEGVSADGKFHSCREEESSDCGFFRHVRGDLWTKTKKVRETEFVCPSFFGIPCDKGDPTCAKDGDCVEAGVTSGSSGDIDVRENKQCAQQFMFGTTVASGGVMYVSSFHDGVVAPKVWKFTQCPETGVQYNSANSTVKLPKACAEYEHTITALVDSRATEHPYQIAFYPTDANGKPNGESFSFDFPINCHNTQAIITTEDLEILLYVQIIVSLVVLCGGGGCFLYQWYHHGDLKIIIEEKKRLSALKKEGLAKGNLLEVELLGASGLAAADGPSLMHPAGSSDPYAVVFLDDVKVAQTKVVWHNLDPMWNEPVLLPIDDTSVIRVQVWDYDHYSAPDFLGQHSWRGSTLKALPLEGEDCKLKGNKDETNLLVQGTVRIGVQVPAPSSRRGRHSQVGPSQTV